MSNMPWFRLYSEVLSDRKIVRVCRITNSPKVLVIGIWNILLALANDSPERGKLLLTKDIPYTPEDIAAESEYPIEDILNLLDAFRQMNMICGQEVIEINNWDKRQFRSDDSSDRVARYRKNRQKSGLPITPQFDSATIIKRDNNECVYCGGKNNLCVDHILPTSLGGTDDINNLVAACRKCNSGKAGRTPEQANYKIKNKDAQKRYSDYLSSVTVTDIADNSYRNTPEQNRTEHIKIEEEEGETIPATPAASIPFSDPTGTFADKKGTFANTAQAYSTMQDHTSQDVAQLYRDVTGQMQPLSANIDKAFGDLELVLDYYPSVEDAIAPGKYIYDLWCQKRSAKTGKTYSPLNIAWIEKWLENLARDGVKEKVAKSRERSFKSKVDVDINRVAKKLSL